jgi:DHA1 family multidrug resistance protein-like MFS transporter
MDPADKYIETAEEDASPERFRSTAAVSDPEKNIVEEHEPVTRIDTGSSSSSSSSGASAAADRDAVMSRLPTQRDEVTDLERHPTALSRIQTQRSQHSNTVGATIKSRTKSRQSRKPLPAFGGGKPFPPPLPEREEYVVEFDGPDDPLHAQNWSTKKKVTTAVILGFTTLTSAFGSSIFSAATRVVAMQYGVGTTVGVLGTSFYVLGFATGPIFWAPFSELKGRRLPLVLASFGFSIFNIAVAAGKDLQTILICRFWAGFFGACPLTVSFLSFFHCPTSTNALQCVAAVFSDMFNNRTRGMAITIFSMTVFTGPLLAPFIGGFIVISDLGWRWTEWIVSIMGFTAFFLNLFFLSESYPPEILVAKASELRRRTKNWGIHAKQEEIEIDFRELMEKNFSRPLRMLISEPIVLL